MERGWMRRCDCPLRMQRNLVHDLYFAQIAPSGRSLCQVLDCGLACLNPKHAIRCFSLCWKDLQGGAFCVHGILSSSRSCVSLQIGAPSEAVCFRAGNVDHLVVLYSCVGSSVSMKGNSMVQACVCFAADRRFASVHRDPRAS